MCINGLTDGIFYFGSRSFCSRRLGFTDWTRASDAQTGGEWDGGAIGGRDPHDSSSALPHCLSEIACATFGVGRTEPRSPHAGDDGICPAGGRDGRIGMSSRGIRACDRHLRDETTMN